MKNMKFWRTALVAALVLTVMLSVTGGTIAWFTDEVVSGENLIKAGNLDIEVNYKNHAGAQWADLEEADSLFTDVLWEPGHTEVVYLQVKNAGTLALNFKANFEPVNEIEGVNVAGETFKISDHLAFGMTEEAATEQSFADKAEARAAIAFQPESLGIDQKIFTEEVMLAPNAEAYFALVIYMPETIGNEANYRGDTVPSVSLKVNVMARQAMSESDSFDSTYDEFSNAAANVNAGNVDEYLQGGYIDGSDAEMVVFNEDVYMPGKTMAYINTELPSNALGVYDADITAENVLILDVADIGMVHIADCNITLDEGGKLLINEHESTATLSVNNVMINGELITQENVDQYLEGNINAYVWNQPYNWTNTDTFITEENVDEFLEGGHVVNSPSTQLIVQNKDMNVPGKTALYVETMPGSAAIISNVEITAKNVFVTEVGGFIVFDSITATLDEGGKLFINMSDEICQVAAFNITINGNKITSWDELLPYIEGTIAYAGFGEDSYGE